ncbi:methyl-accepting chemotaxis protein [Jeongeupia sp. HS-3]|uniref:methyl-accepting chemotaxis protein n=1 Tax=Jeongeupia sp. HS-3 TaxID=1009682 RepID=UPI0019101F88|nr:methyl-accepting chemotaxis protein [Jeongeupia sp. HS-3]
MTISARLVLTFAIALFSLLFIGGFGLWQLKQAQQRFDEVQIRSLASFTELNSAKDGVDSLRLSAYKHVLSTNAAEQQRWQKDIDQRLVTVDTALQNYAKTYVFDAEDQRLLAADKAGWAAYRTQLATALEHSRARDLDGARLALNQNRGSKLHQILNTHIEHNMREAAALAATNAAAYEHTMRWTIGVVLACLLLTAVLAGQLFAHIRTGLSAIQHTLRHVAETLDFTQRVRAQRNDEIGLTATAFNRLLDRLQANLKSMMALASEVAGSARTLNESAEQVSTAASSQSEASASIAATVEEMTVSVSQVAERATDARQMAAQSGQLAASGSATVSQTVQDIRSIADAVQTAAATIRELEAHSAEVSSVVQVIKEVADQTNLLALNAAIEAARAGENGRGFAVVADEVRKLAERTTQSTQQIADTIEAMRLSAASANDKMLSAETYARDGVERVDATDSAIHRIGESAGATADVVGEIALSIREHGAASNTIAGQIERIAQMAEQASAAAERSRSSAHSLDQLAAQQMQTLQQYAL